MKKLIIIVLLIPTILLHAQTDFRPGYIIKNSGDTLYGEVDYRGDLLMSSLCKFKTAENTINNYSPQDIQAYRFINSKYFVSREVNGKKTFFEYLIHGKVNIYYMRDIDGDHYFIDKDGMNLTEMPYEEGTKLVGDTRVYYETTKHVGLLTYFMQDAPQLQSRIQSIKKPEHQELIKLAEDYHNAVCKGEKCVIYEKRLPIIKIFPEFVGGVINFPNTADLNATSNVQTGVIGHVWMPRTSEKLYFRTGLLFSRVKIDGELSNSFKIPCQLEYIYPKGIFRPRLAYGLNICKQMYQSVSLNLGGNIDISGSCFLSITSDIEFEQFVLFVPQELLSYSIQIGFFIDIK